MLICLPKPTFKKKDNYNDIVMEFDSYKVISDKIPNFICLLLVILLNIINNFA